MSAVDGAEILRSAQKDEVYSNQVKDEISDLLLRILGPRHWLPYKDYIDASSRFIYFALTTLSGYQVISPSSQSIVYYKKLKESTFTDSRRRIFWHCSSGLFATKIAESASKICFNHGFLLRTVSNQKGHSKIG